MCGRYTGNDIDSNTLREIYDKTKEKYPAASLKSGEIFPTELVPVLAGGALTPFPAYWGYPGFGSKGVIINARAETAAEKAMFRDSLLNRRCVIPTTGYLEWSEDKVKYKFNLPGTEMLYLGGFCKRFNDVIKFVILTTAPNESVRGVHNRMPLILTEEQLGIWTRSTPDALRILGSEMPALIKEAV